MSAISEALADFSRPGVQSLVGLQRVARLQGELRFYFRQFGRLLELLDFARIYERFSAGLTAPPAESRVEQASKEAEAMLLTATSALRELLGAQVRPQLIAAFLEADSEARELIEAQEAHELDRLGPSGEGAVAFAEREAARLVTQLDEHSRRRIAELVAQSLRELQGPDWLARAIRGEILEMSRARALRIAATEINAAMSEATLQRMGLRGVLFKSLVLAPGADPLCVANKQAGPIPLHQAFPSGQQRPPFHPNCRCSLISARPR